MNEIKQEMSRIMADKEVSNNKPNKKWEVVDKNTKILKNPDCVAYVIDKKLLDDMFKYTQLRTEHIDVKPDIAKSEKDYYNIYIIHDKARTLMASTGVSVMAAIKNALYGYYRNEPNNKLYNFDNLEGLEVKLIGCVSGKLTDAVKNKMYDDFVNTHKLKIQKINEFRKTNPHAVNTITNGPAQQPVIDAKIPNVKIKKSTRSKQSSVVNTILNTISTSQPATIDTKITTSSSQPAIDAKSNTTSSSQPAIDAKSNTTSMSQPPVADTKKSLSKEVMYKKERHELCKKVMKILNIDVESKNNVFITADVTVNEQNEILKLKDDCKKYFVIWNWPFFKNIQIDNEWLSLTKSIFKNCNYIVGITKVFVGGKIVKEGYYVYAK
jgi:hypothetical protein